MKLDLPDVTLVCADCLDSHRAEVVLEKCKEKCNFGAVKLFTSLPTAYPHKVEIKPLKTLYAYSAFCLTRLSRHVQTSHMLVVQHDGWILNAEAWNPAWLDYDYVAPLWIHDHHVDDYSVGSGGFSLRSTRLMEKIAQVSREWDDEDGDMSWGHEDGEVAITHRYQLMQHGFKFAPAMEASKFAQGGQCDPAYYVPRPFGFHGLWPNIDKETGFVHPWVRRA